MKRIALLFALSLAPHAIAADTPQQARMKECNAQAEDMKGDERKAFMKTCLSAAKEDKKGAMKEEKPATEDKKSAQQDKMTKCNADAKAENLAGDARKAFMKTCLSAAKEDKGAMKEEKPATEDKKSAQQDKMTKCNADAKAKNLAGDERKAFMKKCLSG